MLKLSVFYLHNISMACNNSVLWTRIATTIKLVVSAGSIVIMIIVVLL